MAVRKVFVDLYNKGIIYRGERIINWDPQARTALSDIEVIHEDVQVHFIILNIHLQMAKGILKCDNTSGNNAWRYSHCRQS